MSGGCLIFAKALKGALGRRARLVDLVEPENPALRYAHPGLPHHALVEHDGALWDAFGRHTPAEVIEAFTKGLIDGGRAPLRPLVIEPHDKVRAKEQGYTTKLSYWEEQELEEALAAVVVSRDRKKNVPVPDELRRDVWYHGTPSDDAAKGILAHGLKPGHGSYSTKSIRHDLGSLAGAVYLTRDVSEALKYGGGLLSSGDVPWGDYGYVFEFSGASLGDVVPDEDYVAAAAWAGLGGPKGNLGEDVDYDEEDSATGLRSFAAGLWESHPAVAKRIAAVVMAKMPRVASDLEIGFDLARHGKKLLPLVSDADRTALLKAGAPAAHSGPPLKPVAAWRFRRSWSEEEAVETDMSVEELDDELRDTLERGASLPSVEAERIR